MEATETIPEPFPDYNEDFVDPKYLDAFATALEIEDEMVATSPQSTSTNVSEYFHRNGGDRRRVSVKDANGNAVELIESQHDWAPIHKKLKKKAKGKAPDKMSFSTSFKILRYPILLAIMAWVMFLFLVYLILRIYVSTFETASRWSREKRRLREELNRSMDYEQWVSNAKKLDDYMGLEEWKREDKYYYYDYKTLRIIVGNLAKFRTKCQNEELMSVLQSCLKQNFAGTENPALYSKTHYGTKRLIEKYNEEVVKSIDYVIGCKEIDEQDKRHFFKIVDKNFGKSALCLSGGATFAYNHFGVIKALIDNDSLPQIISGTSGGGVVAALACSRTNEELRQILVPKLADKITACSEPFSVWFPRWRRTGARFDALSFASKAHWFTRGELTFQEMYKSTGKRLNISTVPSNPHSPVILCNEITSPNCIVWSSLLASSAVPGILNPVVLMMKDKNGDVVPFSFGNRWKDGSLRTDIPVEALNNYYNVKFSIVSQVNPHISLFSYAPKGSVGDPVTRNRVDGLRGGFLVASLEHLIKLDITKWLKLIKSLDLFPRIMDQDWSNIWLQKFSGTITLFPKLDIRDLYYILTDPDEKRLAKMLRNGQLCAYPKMLFIEHRLNIERAIERGKKACKKRRAHGVATTDDGTHLTTPPTNLGPSDDSGTDVEIASNEIVGGLGLNPINLDEDYYTTDDDDEDYLDDEIRGDAAGQSRPSYENLGRFALFESSDDGEDADSLDNE